MSKGTNQGIIVSGGTITARNIAVGDQASIVDQSSNEPSPVQRELATLRQLIEANQAKLDDYGDVIAVLASAEEELAKPEPNKLTAKSLLDGIAGAAKPITEIVQAVAKVVALI